METLSNIAPDILTVAVEDANPAWIGESLQMHAERGASLGNLFVARLAYELITLADGKPLVGTVDEYLVKVGRGMSPLPGSTDRYPHKPAHFGETPRKALRGIEPIISSADDVDLLASLASGEMGWKAAAERFAERVELRGTVGNMLTEGQQWAAQARDRAAAFRDNAEAAAAFVAPLAILSAMLGGLESAAAERPVPNKDGAFASLNALKAAVADVNAVAARFEPETATAPEPETVPAEPTSTAIADAVAAENAAEVERIEQAAADMLAARETANDAADTRTEVERNRDAFADAVARVEVAYAQLEPTDVVMVASYIDTLANIVDAARVTLAAAAEAKAKAKKRA